MDIATDAIRLAADLLRQARPDVFYNIDAAFPTYVEEEYSNCWGFTAAAIRAEQRLEWLWPDRIIRHLRERTEFVNVPDVGDIIAYWDKEPWDVHHNDAPFRILHTALYIGDNKVLHKPGPLPVEVTGIFSRATYGQSVTYHHIVC